MKQLRSLTALAALGLAFLPLRALAQDFDVAEPPVKPPPVYNNEVRLGAGWQSQTSPQFGRYTGMRNQGPFGIGGFTLGGRDAWDSGGTTYYRLEGNNIPLDSRSFNAQVGQQGTWGATFSYDGIPYYQSNSFRSVFSDANGNLVSGVRPGGVTNVTSQLPGLLRTQTNVGTLRDIYTLGGKFQWNDWIISSSIRHDHKQGFKENSSAWLGTPSPIANNANITNSALAYFLEPVNYDTDRFDINAVYGNTSRMQLLVGYTYNSFTDNGTAWNGFNPFGFTSNAGPIAGTAANLAASANIRSSYALPPSNMAHQIKLQFGYNLTPTTRVNANFQYGLMNQNAAYVASTGNANFTPIGPPRSSFDGTIQTVFGNVAITAMPLPKLDVRASYTIDDRNNLSSRAGYRQYINDAYTANPSVLMNLPASYTNQKAKLEAGYRVLPNTKLTVGYSYEATHRTYSNTNDVSSGEFSAQVRTSLLETVQASLRYMHQDRWAGSYNRGGVFAALGLTTVSDYYGYYNYYLASRVRDEAKGTIDYSPLPGLTASLVGKADYDFYPSSAMGLKSNNNFSIGPDITYEFSKLLSMHAFYNYQKIFFNSNSMVTNATCNGNGTTLTAGSGCLNNGIWNQKTNDETHTFGASLDWQPIPDVLKVSVDYTLSYGNTSYTFADGGIYSFPTAGNVGTAGLFIQALPSTTGLLNSISLHAEYKIRENISLIGGYAFERFSYKDYAYAAGSTQFSNAVFAGDNKPNYAVHVVGAAVNFRW